VPDAVKAARGTLRSYNSSRARAARAARERGLEPDFRLPSMPAWWDDVMRERGEEIAALVVEKNAIRGDAEKRELVSRLFDFMCNGDRATDVWLAYSKRHKGHPPVARYRARDDMNQPTGAHSPRIRRG